VFIRIVRQDSSSRDKVEGVQNGSRKRTGSSPGEAVQGN
jgi:hypothetical protein